MPDNTSTSSVPARKKVGAGEKLVSVVSKVEGTDLDRRLRVAGGTLHSLRMQLSKVEETRTRAVASQDASIESVRALVAEAERAFHEALSEKREKEPDQPTRLGKWSWSGPSIKELEASTGTNRPADVTHADWVKRCENG